MPLSNFLVTVQSVRVLHTSYAMTFFSKGCAGIFPTKRAVEADERTDTQKDEVTTLDTHNTTRYILSTPLTKNS